MIVYSYNSNVLGRGKDSSRSKKRGKQYDHSRIAVDQHGGAAHTCNNGQLGCSADR